MLSKGSSIRCTCFRIHFDADTEIVFEDLRAAARNSASEKRIILWERRIIHSCSVHTEEIKQIQRKLRIEVLNHQIESQP